MFEQRWYKRTMMIAHLLSLYRKEHRLSIRELAKIIGVGHTVLWRFERGQSLQNDHWSKIINWLFTSGFK